MTSVYLKKPLATLPLLLSTLLAPVMSHAASYEMRARMPKLVVTAPSGGASSVGGGTSAGATPLAPLLKISTYAEDLGLVSMGATGTTGLITITNAGTADLSFANSLSVTGAGYSVSSNCGVPLSPGASCVATVSFTPLTPGTVSGTLSLNTSAGVQSVSLTGTGAGPLLSTSASGLAFGDVNVGDTTRVLGIQLNNTGTEASSVGAVRVSGAGANLFGASTTCSGTLEVGGSCLSNITFTPTSSDTSTASLNFETASAVLSVPLSGTGKALTAGGVLVASATSGKLTLTTAATTTLETPASVLLKSGGVTVASSSSVSWEGPSRTLTVTLGTLPAAGSYEATVLNSVGKVIAAAPVTVVNNTASLSVAVGSSSDFGAVALGSSASRTFTFSNTGNIALSGVNPSVFNNNAISVTSSTCGATLAAGASCIVIVTYSPTVIETLAATLKIVSSASNAPALLSLSGSSSPAPDSHGSNVTLLLHMDSMEGSTIFVDSSLNALTLTPYSGTQPTQKAGSAKFGATGGLFPGGANWLTLPASTGLVLSGDFTIEGWVKPAVNTSMVLIGSDYPTRNNQVQVSGSALAIYDGIWTAAGASIPTNAWTYVAIARKGSQMTFFVNGVALKTVTNTSTYNFSGGAIGALRRYTQQTWNGAIDEFRITNGYARYTTNFTLPSEAFPSP